MGARGCGPERIEVGWREVGDKGAVARLGCQPAPKAAEVYSVSGSVLIFSWVPVSPLLCIPCLDHSPLPSWSVAALSESEAVGSHN